MGHLHAPLHGSKAPAWSLGGQARQWNLRDQMGMKQRLMRGSHPSMFGSKFIDYGVGWGASILHLEIYQQHLVGSMKGLMDAGE